MVITSPGSLREHFFGHLLQGAGPLIVWALHFLVSYVLVAAGCCTAFAQSTWLGVPALRIALWAASTLALIVIGLLIARSLRLQGGLARTAGAGCGALALIGVAWTTLPVWALPLCSCT